MIMWLRQRSFIITGIFYLLFMWMPVKMSLAGTVSIGKGTSSSVAAFSREQALLLGEKIYREGILPDGGVIRAFVQGDIPVDGRSFACVRCHRRSGLGTSEGNVVTLPINGVNLFRPRVLWDPRRRHSRIDTAAAGARQVPSYMLASELRPPYTDNSLAKAITTGIDPSGRKLDKIMPRYELDPVATSLLINYLKNLSKNYSPGVTQESLRFATIVTEDVKAEDRQAMLAVLNAHINDRNAQLRNQLKRAVSGAFNRREADTSYRLLELAIWELKGPEEGWYEQLEAYYRQQPVFAILGGISAGDWSEIHRFSEDQGIPTIFPVTDKPVVSTNSWNTVYFSRGLYQEGEAAARFISRYASSTGKTRIFQIYDKTADARMLADGFNSTWEAINKTQHATYTVVNIDASLQNWKKIVTSEANDSIILLWSKTEHGNASPTFQALRETGAAMIIMSSRQLGTALKNIPDDVRSSLYITYPYSLPGDKPGQLKLLHTWLKIKGIPVTNLEIQSKMYFLGWLLADAIVGMKSEYYRDYFLERIEMMKDQTLSIAVFPRLSLGPDQRYASKGCYVVQLSTGANPDLLVKNDWVTH